MIRLLATLTLSLLSDAVGLLAATLLLDDFSIDATGFVVAVLIFALTTTIFGPLIMKIALTNAPYLMGGIALITTLIGLVVTNIFVDGMTVSGLSTWVIATLIVWLFSILGSVLLPLVIFKKTLQKHKEA